MGTRQWGKRSPAIAAWAANRILPLLVALAIAAALAPPLRAEEKEPVEAEMEQVDMAMLDPEALEFTGVPDMPACATAATLRGNPIFGAHWVLLKLGTGCRVPLHWHTANEYMVVIRGQGVLVMRDGSSLTFAPGAYMSLPSHHRHLASCTEECLLLAAADGAFDIHYVDDDGNEISAEEALKPATTKTWAER